MLVLKSCLLVAAISHTATAFFRWYPDYRCVEFGTCKPDTRRHALEADVQERDSTHTLEIVQRNNQPHDAQIQRLAERLSQKYGRGSIRSSPTIQDEQSLEKRVNKYKIMTAAVPTTTATAGIDQDGTDYSYFVKVQLGSNGIAMNMLLDTGAGTSWVMGHDCESAPCKAHNNFGSDDSITFQTGGRNFDLHYGSGDVNGTMTTDTLSVAGFNLTATFGIAKHASDEFKNFPIDGILGLSQTKGNHTTFVETLVAAKLLKANMFGVCISRSTDGPNEGVLNFGAPDTSRFVGDLAYNKVHGDQTDDWSISMDAISFDGKKADLQYKLAYIDTGTSYIFSKPEEVKRLHDAIPGATTENNVTFRVPCTTTQPLMFTFGTNTYAISSRDWVGPNVNGVCTSNVYGHDVVGDGWLLGDTFLKNVYAVFDIDGNRIGFGSRPAPPAPVISSTTSGGPSSSTGVPANTGSSGSLTSNVAIGPPAQNAPQGSEPTTPPGIGGQEAPSSTASAEAIQGSSTPTSGITNNQSAGNRLDMGLTRTAIAMLGLFAFLS